MAGLDSRLVVFWTFGAKVNDRTKVNRC